MSSLTLTLDVLITDDRRVMIQVMVPTADRMKREAIWTTTFHNPHVEDTEDDVRPGAWTPEGEDQVEQIAKAVGRVIELRKPGEFHQLSMLLHMALHNLLEHAKGVLKEER